MRLHPITLRERKECAEVLSQMLNIGWKKTDLDALERLWWSCRRARKEQQEWRNNR